MVVLSHTSGNQAANDCEDHMTPTIITPDNHEHWLKLRAEDITSTEVSALFGLSPYATRFELYHVKSGAAEIDFSDNERMAWGRELEAVIARRTSKMLGLHVQHMPEYYRHGTVPRMGSSFDFSITETTGLDISGTVIPTDGPGILECKNVDGLIYRNNWTEFEAPDHIEFQVQHQMEVADVNWCIIAALVGGNELKLIYRERNRKMGEGMCKAVADFWANVDAKVEPPFTDTDANFVISMYQNAGTEAIDLTEDEEARALAIAYKFHAEQAKLHDTGKDAARAGLLMKMGEAGKAMLDGFNISATMVKGGEVSYTRKPYRGWKLTAKKK